MASDNDKPRGRERVLVIEPDRDMAAGAEALLRESGFVVAVARNMNEALSALTRAPKLILLHAEPVADALAFLRRLRKLRDLKGVPVVVSSGPPLPLETRQPMEELGVVAFLPRPFAEHELADALYLTGSRSESIYPEVEPGPMRSRRPAHRSALPFRAGQGTGGRPTFSMGRPRMPVREVAGTLDFSSGQADAMIEEASQRWITVRAFEPYPDVGQPVRVLFSLEEIDESEALQVRVAGRVDTMEVAGGLRRLKIKIGGVSDGRGLDRLSAWLAG